MIFLYNISIKAYYLFILFSSPFYEKARKWITGRTSLFENLRKDFAKNTTPVIWFHVASLGEFEQGRPVMEEYKKQFPDHKILLTFFSPSGYEVRKNYKEADFIHYLPLDTRKNAQKFISIVKPQKVVFVKYEFWYHYLKETIRNGIPVFVISAIFRSDQLFFKSYGKWYGKILKKMTRIFVQTRQSFELLQSYGFENVELSGDTRFDRVYKICKNPQPLPALESWIQPEWITLIGGSTWAKEEEMLAQFHNAYPKLNLIIAPHEIHESNLIRIEKLFSGNIVRFSQLESKSERKKVVLMDQMGLLSSVYQFGDIAFIGGGFGKGIHNILEPATFGLPVIFGPAYQKFNEALTLIKEKGAFPIKNYKELNKRLLSWMENPADLKKASEKTSLYIKNNIGATSQILKVLTIY